MKISKKGALQVTETLDRVASLFESEWKRLGLSKKIAKRFSHQCDMFSDHVERVAGIRRAYDAEQVGIEKSGPLQQDSDEAFMNSEFTQQENRELHTRFQDGQLSDGEPVLEPVSPVNGRKASVKKAAVQMIKQSVLNSVDKIVTLSKTASNKNKKQLIRIAKLMITACQNIDASHDLVYASKIDEVADGLMHNLNSPRLAAMIDLASAIIANEDEDDEDEDEDVVEAKKTAKKAEEDDDESDEDEDVVEAKKTAKKAEEDDDDESEDDEDDEESDKQASHGFILD
jgi:hypothetical protein